MIRIQASPRSALGLGVIFSLGCGGTMSAPNVTVDESAAVLTATVGPSGGVIEAPESQAFEGFAITIPSGALSGTTTIRVRRVEDETPLPPNAFRVGLQFQLDAAGATLAQPMSIRLPVDATTRNSFGGNAGDVKVWARASEGWTLIEPASTSASRVVIQSSAFTTMAAGVRLTFSATPPPSFCGSATVPCSNTQVVAPAVGHAPAPCTITGGFCVEPLVGGANNPAPPADTNMVVGPGFVTYGERLSGASTQPQPRRAIQLRMSNLAVSHGQTTPSIGFGSIPAHLPGSWLYSGTNLQRFLGLDNAAPPSTSAVVSGQPMGTAWATVGASTARNFFIQSNPRAIAMFDVNNTNARTPLAPIPVSNGVIILGSERGSPGVMWVVQDVLPFAQQQNGVNPGVLRRIGPDGTFTVSVADTSPPSLLLVDLGGGGSGGSGGGNTGPTIFYANARRAVLNTFTATNTAPRLSMVDLTSATPTLTPLNIPTPTQATNGVDGFRAAVLDDRDRVWFVFGSTFHEELFVFDPATNSTQGVPITGFRPHVLGFDGTHVIVSARNQEPSMPSQIFRVRPFGT
jgi:hypothetical protein